MIGGVQGTRRAWSGRRIAATSAAIVAAAALWPVIGALVAPRALPGQAPAAATVSGTGLGAGRLAGGTGIPAGWAPVPYLNAQLSVPGRWVVEAPGQFWCAPPSLSRGMIFAGTTPRIPRGTGCGPTANRAWLVPAGPVRPGARHRRPAAVINGIRVYRLPAAPGSVRYLVPDLGVLVGARGQLARRVLTTLTRSPLSVVLGHGPAGPVPAGWIGHRFGGVGFAAPRSWRLQREHQWATCGTGLVPRTLLLIDATRPPAPLPCPFPFPTGAAEQALPGLTVVTGKYAAVSVGGHFARCQVRRGTRICLSTLTGNGGFTSAVLIFSASRPRQHGATFFVLGLSGSGNRARAIFGSVLASRH